MRWEVNYTADAEIMENFDYKPKPEDAIDIEKSFKSMMNYLDKYSSQFIEESNPDKEKKIKWFYKRLAEMAFFYAGHVILEINERKKTATLKYMGKFLSKSKEENDKTGLIIALIFYTYDLVTIENEEKYFSITIHENLFDQVMIHDKRAELDRIRNKMRRKNREIFKRK